MLVTAVHEISRPKMVRRIASTIFANIVRSVQYSARLALDDYAVQSSQRDHIPRQSPARLGQLLVEDFLCVRPTSV
jgi:hypothetical protein